MKAILSRRDMLRTAGMGMGSLALTGVLRDAGLLAGEPGSLDPRSPLVIKRPHYAPKAKRVIHIFVNGGASQVDTFDPKPKLTEYHGKELPTGNLKTMNATGAAMGSPFKFRKAGRCGMDVSDVFPSADGYVDDICLIRSMQTEIPNHPQGMMMMNCGDSLLSRPSIGSWVLYGLGTENQNLPGFIAMCPDGTPTGQAANWRSSFLPGVYQGTYLDTRETRIDKLIANIRNRSIAPENQARQISLVERLNDLHKESREGDDQLDARIASFETAFRMQTEATDAFDITREPIHIRELYGETTHGRQMLMARRLLERGVRYVQVYHSKGQPWDAHERLEENHRRLGGEMDQPIAALMADLKVRGMLEDTLVIWAGEFGRTPAYQLEQRGNTGRDHNHHGFSIWLAGAGVRRGHTYGVTDEFGYAAIEGQYQVHDLQATILHLLGLDHTKLTYRYSGRDFRLTDVHGNVMHPVLA